MLSHQVVRCEFDLDNRLYLRFTPSEGPVRRIEVRIGFRDAAKIEVTALLWDTPVRAHSGCR